MDVNSHNYDRRGKSVAEKEIFYMDNCLFCNIINGEIPSEKVYEDEYVYAFNDISPVAPVHVLVVPKEHISFLNEINSENSSNAAKIFEAIAKIAIQLGLEKDGYRIVSNCGAAAGQTVNHIHYHLLGGRDLAWPPG